jgi:hypothetical protein
MLNQVSGSDLSIGYDALVSTPERNHGRLRSGYCDCQGRSLTEWRGYLYALSNSAAEAADVVTERNPRASEFKGQRYRLLTPIASSSLIYFYINSIAIRGP